ncbi:hypothetical protein NOV72_02479 [Caballeronia novacaledonica]|uniref:Uncharacterized protein n=1 Tax=Caballeronia novacaledonica TaxID=1544861 RepID=A0A2U3I509_9BURK|nr:hypothetical protein [Caballeronia novacaledonica]SPB15253.1 hypothetical protein NOV72_02479 [Caballeronia novacaledonica]
MCAICNFKIEFGVGHPSALTVAVATREAIEAGRVEQMEEAQGPLAAARARMSAIDALNLLQARIEATHTPEQILALPDFYVFLIETDTWGFFHATVDGFDPDIVPDIPDVTNPDAALRSNVIVASEAGLRSFFDGSLSADLALRESVFLVEAPEDARAGLEHMLLHSEAALADMR